MSGLPSDEEATGGGLLVTTVTGTIATCRVIMKISASAVTRQALGTGQVSISVVFTSRLHQLYTKPSLFSESYKYVVALSIYSNFMVHALMDKERALVGFEPIQH